ncbi:hypothetical protein JB92DRAFT_3132455 [Gautieria morchelliformis]|nr:hypothetical protein JB92DRAFT_3132455 [Gautieria morchelliformis]
MTTATSRASMRYRNTNCGDTLARLEGRQPSRVTSALPSLYRLPFGPVSPMSPAWSPLGVKSPHDELRVVRAAITPAPAPVPAPAPTPAPAPAPTAARSPTTPSSYTSSPTPAPPCPHPTAYVCAPAVSELKNVSGSVKLPYGALALGPEGIKDAITNFDDTRKSDIENERLPSDPTDPMSEEAKPFLSNPTTPSSGDSPVVARDNAWHPPSTLHPPDPRSTLDATYYASRLISDTVPGRKSEIGVELARRTELVEVLPKAELFPRADAEMESEPEAESEMESELDVVSELEMENRVSPDSLQAALGEPRLK